MPTGRANLVAATSPEWMDALEGIPHDVFHRADYHSLTGFGHQGTPYLFTYREEGGAVFLWPYLMRPIPDTTDSSDVSSVYGYAGPLCRGDSGFAGRAWRALIDHWRLQGVVSAFTRFHPMLRNAELFGGILTDTAAGRGLCPAGSTVSIDLSLPSTEQIRRYQKVMRQEIRKSRDLGFITAEDSEWEATDTFVRLYRETMARRNSRDEYLVDEAWVNQFRRTLGSHARLFVTKQDGHVAGALLAIEYAPFLHAHLTGINSEMATHSPLKVLLDDVREWGTQRGLQTFHLGGGLGGREDSLFQFKRRFSPVTHEFKTGRWILEPARYEEFEHAHRERLLRNGYSVGNPEFFPIYRYQPLETDSLSGQATP